MNLLSIGMDQIGKPLLAGLIAYAGGKITERGMPLNLGLISLPGSAGLGVTVAVSEFLTETCSDVLLPKLFNQATITDFKTFLNPSLTGATTLAISLATDASNEYIIPFLLGAVPSFTTNASYAVVSSYIPKY
jgi:hypothetical protein